MVVRGDAGGCVCVGLWARVSGREVRVCCVESVWVCVVVTWLWVCVNSG